MEAVERKDKLIKQFQTIIQDESKLDILDGIFDAMTVNATNDSLISDKHYKIIEERRQNRLLGETKGKPWNNVKNELKQKYGF